ncbi:trace amine-associated receptor 13c-like [Denticeps clupeoides]|uniref:G-protein coupled receptors family 1 profile domain-containing protein n=1 Tax=Denticeps clupeoides TaxID=299321 RepID=A0AAY4CXS8_9TELE|nr:trace amine-associated receptor 13c-like [Denticeps clupeoides]
MSHDKVNQTHQCLLPSNTSCSGNNTSPGLYAFLYLCVAAVVVITACGNLLVIISVCHFKQFHTPTNFVILSLAFSDFLVGVFVMPFRFIMLIESCWLFGAVFCVVFNLFVFHLTCVSVYNVSLIAVERYMALNNPFLYSLKATVNVILSVIVLTWVLSLLYNIVLLYVNGNFSDVTACSEDCHVIVGDGSAIFDLIVVFVLPCATMMILYLKVFAIARKHAIAIRANIKDRRKNDLQNSDSMKSERKAAKVLGILVLVFLVCLVPFYISSLFLGFIKSQFYYGLIDKTLTLFYLNSTINPMIYALFHPSFQKSMKLILTCKIFSKDSSIINVLSRTK